MFKFVRNYNINHIISLADDLNFDNISMIKVEKSFYNGDQESMNLVYLSRPIPEDQIRSKINSFLIFKHRRVDSIAIEIVKHHISFRIVIEKHERGYKMFSNEI